MILSLFGRECLRFDVIDHERQTSSALNWNVKFATSGIEDWSKRLTLGTSDMSDHPVDCITWD